MTRPSSTCTRYGLRPTRGQDAATGLLDEAVRWARACGAAAMQSGVNCANTTALRLYMRVEFPDMKLRESMRPGSNQIRAS